MPGSTSNRLLHSLTPGLRANLLSHCRDLDLPVGSMLQESKRRPVQAFFLNSGFASHVVTVPPARSSEVGLISREGLVGGWALLGNADPPGECFMQSDGSGCSLPIEQLQHVFHHSAELRTRVLECVQQQTMATAYVGACAKLHKAEPRLARWLLMVQDRLGTDLLPLKQEFLAQMLTTRRMTVSTTAAALQRQGMIEYKRGSVRILDRARLEQTACACYRRLRALDDGLYRSSSPIPAPKYPRNPPIASPPPTLARRLGCES